MKIGAYYDLPMEEYLRDPGIGSSNLKILVNETPRDFKYRCSVPFQDTKATTIGTAVHTGILEPHLFNKQFALQPKDWGPLNRIPGKPKWAEFKKENEGKTCLNWDDSETVRKALGAADESANIQSILGRSRKEITGFYCADKIRLKARSDIHEESKVGRFIWDVKTTAKPLDHASLTSMIFKYGYHFQAAHHMHVFNKIGLPADGFGWIFVSTAPGAPQVTLRTASEELLQYGNKQLYEALEILVDCTNLNYWPGHDEDDYEEIMLPGWIKR